RDRKYRQRRSGIRRTLDTLVPRLPALQICRSGGPRKTRRKNPRRRRSGGSVPIPISQQRTVWRRNAGRVADDRPRTTPNAAACPVSEQVRFRGTAAAECLLEVGTAAAPVREAFARQQLVRPTCTDWRR